MLLDFRAFGQIPNRVQGGDLETSTERSLLNRFQKTTAGGRFTAEYVSDLAAMLDQLVQGDDQLMQDLRAFGRVPKRMHCTDHQTVAERNLAKRFRKARAGGVSPQSTSRSWQALAINWCRSTTK